VTQGSLIFIIQYRLSIDCNTDIKYIRIYLISYGFFSELFSNFVQHMCETWINKFNKHVWNCLTIGCVTFSCDYGQNGR